MNFAGNPTNSWSPSDSEVQKGSGKSIRMRPPIWLIGSIDSFLINFDIGTNLMNIYGLWSSGPELWVQKWRRTWTLFNEQFANPQRFISHIQCIHIMHPMHCTSVCIQIESILLNPAKLWPISEMITGQLSLISANDAGPAKLAR